MTTRHYIPAMGRDRLLPLYDTFTWLAGVPSAHRRLVDAARIEPGQDVLEVGCGTGSLAVLVKRRQPTAIVAGLDPDPTALARAHRKAARRGLDIRWDRGFAGELPYPDASVHRVLSALMFHHLDAGEKDRMLREVWRVLRPGGALHLLDFGGTGATRPHAKGFAELTEDNLGDRIPARMREAGFTDVVETGRVRLRIRGGRCATFRALR